VRTYSSHLGRRVPAVAAFTVLAAVGSATASPRPDELHNRIAGVKRHESALQSSIQSDTARVRRLRGPIDDLRVRLDALQTSFAIERRELDTLQGQLRDARARLALLEARLARGRVVLAEQLVADYESSRPDLTTVILESHGFADLLERVELLRRIEHANVRATVEVKAARVGVTRQAARLADLEARQQRITSAVLIQRQEIARLRYALISRRLTYAHDRAQKNARLDTLQSHRRRLERDLAEIQGPSTLDGLVQNGAYGFFQYPGTNYTVGSEPELAARLNNLAKALHLHLIGISGYRTPQHSVEVGGFANDPHTQGEASDTLGVEGVPEATLEQFGLTRPFGGAAEANHIQLLR
jgi:peptidoglycan hydrolase CwlO-like protein